MAEIRSVELEVVGGRGLLSSMVNLQVTVGIQFTLSEIQAGKVFRVRAEIHGSDAGEDPTPITIWPPFIRPPLHEFPARSIAAHFVINPTGPSNNIGQLVFEAEVPRSVLDEDPGFQTEMVERFIPGMGVVVGHITRYDTDEIFARAFLYDAPQVFDSGVTELPDQIIADVGPG